MVYSYLGTRTERAIHELLDRGGVVGGESAGAMIQASWLDTTDDEFTPEIRALIKTYGRGGFALLKRAAVFPHFDERGSAAAVKFSAEYPDELGIGIDNATALIIKGDRVEVHRPRYGQHIRRETARRCGPGCAQQWRSI